MTPPSSIAHYRITSKLGAGGMGEVYEQGNITMGNRNLFLCPLESAVWSGPLGLHTLENVGDADLRVIAVEVESAPA